MKKINPVNYSILLFGITLMIMLLSSPAGVSASPVPVPLKNSDEVNCFPLMDSDSATDVYEAEEDLQPEGYDFTVTGEDISSVSYPSSYDPRPLNMVTSVKDQGQWGVCWAFAATSTMESYLIKKGYENNTVDLSEMYNIYHQYYFYNYNDETFTKFCNSGNGGVALHMDWNDNGPVYETRVPWTEPTDSCILNENIFNNPDYIVLKHIKYDDSITVSVNKIKYLISEYGAVETGVHATAYENMGYKFPNQNEADGNLYIPAGTTLTSNHAISIVGWDDSYSKDNFLYPAPDNGAFLCKNSWGTGTQVGSGYFWLSYYDSIYKTHEAEAYSLCKKNEYIYDFTLNTKYINLQKNTIPSQKIEITTVPAGMPLPDITFSCDNQDISFTKTEGGYTVSLKEPASVKKDYTVECRFSDDPSMVPKTLTIRVLPDVALTGSYDYNKNVLSCRYVNADGYLIGGSSWSGQNLKFSSSDESVATIDQEGNVTPAGFGITQLKASDMSGLNLPAVTYAYAKMPNNISFGEDIYMMEAKDGSLAYSLWIMEDASPLPLKILFNNETDMTGDKRLSYVSSDTSVAEVSGEGVITAKSSGTAVVTVSFLEYTQKLIVNVKEKDTSVSAPSVSEEPASPTAAPPSEPETAEPALITPAPTNAPAPAKKTSQTIKKKANFAVKKSGKKILVTWKKTTDIKAVQIQISLPRKFTAVRTKSTAKTSLKLGQIKAGKKHYIRVRAYGYADGKKIYGPWSNIKTITVK